ncbi:MAG: ISL3 family transposase, partial [Lachnospiraceae bacterium]
MVVLRYTPTHDYSFLLDENHYVYDHVEDNDCLHIYIKSTQHGCICPECGKLSTKLHATYRRKLQDTPIHCKQTYLHANVYKYDCENTDCNCKVFMEELPFAKESQVRTDALNTLVLATSMFLSNEGASKVLALLGVQISNDTIQRLYDRIEFVDHPDVEEIGVDDVAIRKGQTYATAIYDLKDHHLIALLDGRDGQPLKEWLKTHKKVRIVARDRASAYATAISEILPDCVQVADRFHLLQNLLGYMKDIFKEEMPAKIYIQNGEISEKAPEKVL